MIKDTNYNRIVLPKRYHTDNNNVGAIVEEAYRFIDFIENNEILINTYNNELIRYRITPGLSEFLFKYFFTNRLMVIGRRQSGITTFLAVYSIYERLVNNRTVITKYKNVAMARYVRDLIKEIVIDSGLIPYFPTDCESTINDCEHTLFKTIRNIGNFTLILPEMVRNRDNNIIMVFDDYYPDSRDNTDNNLLPNINKNNTSFRSYTIPSQLHEVPNSDVFRGIIDGDLLTVKVIDSIDTIAPNFI